MQVKVYVCLINVGNASTRIHTKGMNLLIGVYYKLKHSVLVESFVLNNMGQSTKNETLLHHTSLDPFGQSRKIHIFVRSHPFKLNSEHSNGAALILLPLR